MIGIKQDRRFIGQIMDTPLSTPTRVFRDIGNIIENVAEGHSMWHALRRPATGAAPAGTGRVDPIGSMLYGSTHVRTTEHAITG